MPDITLNKSHTALLIADFYAEQMSKLPHAVSRKCVDNTLALRQAARAAGIFVCYSATVFRPDYVEVSERNKIFSERKRTGGPAIADPLKIIHPRCCRVTASRWSASTASTRCSAPTSR